MRSVYPLPDVRDPGSGCDIHAVLMRVEDGEGKVAPGGDTG